MTHPLANDPTLRIRELDRGHHLHPWAHFDSFEVEGPQFVSAEGRGARVTDANGKSYLDAVGGLWCTNIGLGREEMVEAIAEQTRKLAYAPIFGDMTNEPAAELSAKVAELAPADLNHVILSTGGSTAVDSAYRLVQYYQSCAGRPEKHHVIARESAYHGSTYATMSIGKRKGDRAPEFQYQSETIHHVSAPYAYRRPDGVTEAGFTDWLVEEFENKIAAIGPDKVGGFFAEPVMGAGGVIVPPDGYLQRMRAVCQKYDILYISDEVVTGFGRLGHWFASESRFGIVPDIICSAKGLSSGYLPIGATIYSDRIHEVISRKGADRVYTSGFTYSGHPVCCAAALKNIEIMERENLLDHARDVGGYFEERLQELGSLRIVGEIRGCKLMMCVENVMNKETREVFPAEVKIGDRIADTCESMGLIVRPLSHLNVMSPSLVITREDVDFIVNTLREAISTVTDSLVEEGRLPPG